MSYPEKPSGNYTLRSYNFAEDDTAKTPMDEYLFKHGYPFIKKLSFTRHNGMFGKQLKYILNHCDKPAANAIIKTANYLYGEKYVNWLLTYNPLKILYRTIIYGKNKLKDGWI